MENTSQKKEGFPLQIPTSPAGDFLISTDTLIISINNRNYLCLKYNVIAQNYTDTKGEKRPMYEITKDSFMFLVMGFTGKKAAQFKET